MIGRIFIRLPDPHGFDVHVQFHDIVAVQGTKDGTIVHLARCEPTLTSLSTEQVMGLMLDAQREMIRDQF